MERMEEKKIPDDELLRLLEIFAKDDEPNGVRLLAEGALDLIHRQQAEIERLTEEKKTLVWLNQSLKKQVDELKKERENVQKILYELGKCGNDKERYAVWVKLIKYCGVEVE